MSVHRYFVTGTDTDVGKTRVAAALARALRDRSVETTMVKCVQTGVAQGEAGDAERAGKLAGVGYVELARFALAADPWSAALDQRAPLLTAAALASEVEAIPGAVVVEGSGGLAVPINAGESLADVARRAGLKVVIAVGLRLGCLNHALLTLAHCRHMGLSVSGVVLVERWAKVSAGYRADVERTLQDKAPVLGILPFCADEPSAVAAAKSLFDALL